MKTPLKFLLGAAAGAIYGMAFSQKNGKKFRAELSQSKEPLKVLWEEAKNMFQDSKSVVEKHSEKFELDPLLKKMNLTPDQIKSFKDLLAQAKSKGGDAIKHLKEQFNALNEEESTPENQTETTETEAKKTVAKKTTTKTTFKNKVDEDQNEKK